MFKRKKMTAVILLVVMITCFAQGCAATDAENTIAQNSNTESTATPKEFYSLDDFKSIVPDVSTAAEIYEIVSMFRVASTAEGGASVFPTEDGQWIVIRFYGPELVVDSIKVVSDLSQEGLSVPDEDAESHSGETIPTDQLPRGLNCYVEDLPPIDSFSSAGYEEYTDQFPPVDYAILHTNGMQRRIPADDPALFRLLNYLARSFNERTHARWTQYAEENLIMGYLDSEATMLEIVFQPSQEPPYTVLAHTPRMLICENSCLLFVDTSMPNWELGEGMYGRMFYPYDVLLQYMIDEGTVDESIMRDQYSWGKSTWIDLLEYAGVVEE